MGNECSVGLARPVDGLRNCGTHDLLCEDDECGCGSYAEEMPIGLHNAAHPLMQEHSDRVTPRTPRGPVPPWAVSRTAPVDRTATGATPPRSPTPPRLTPPGLPDDDLRHVANALTLNVIFDAKFVQELFCVTRSGNASMLSSLLQQVNAQALSSVCREQCSTQDSATVNERYEQASDLVASFLSKARDLHAPREPLLSAAAIGGHADSVQILLSARADPHACDDQGCSPLHRASSSGNLLVVLLVLDRVQANLRSISLAELTNLDGETPEMFAALAGASDICRAFEVFSDMQNDAELRQLGSNFSPPDAGGGLRGVGTGDVLTFIDLAADVRSPPGTVASALLRRSALGCGLLQSVSKRIPHDEAELRQLIEMTCQGICRAEEILLSSTWNPADPGLDPVVRSFVTTAELRGSWQKLRTDTAKSRGNPSLRDFWQTHLTAEIMVSTLKNAAGDTFQILLTVLWLYTREAWLRHVLDAVAAALHTSTMLQGNDSTNTAEGATGATPHWRSDVPSALQPIVPLVDALAPCMQLVQSALGWFEEAGIRHSSVTYRPLSLPMLGLQRLVDKYVSLRHGAEAGQEAGPISCDRGESQAVLGNGAWIALGAGSFFSSMSSRSEAIKKLSRTRCNVLLVVRPDEVGPCYPKHMSLRGSSMDDTLFPLNALFRIVRITRSVSSDLDPEVCSRANSSRWPVMIIELHSTSRHIEALELLERRGSLFPGELEVCLREWMANASPDEEQERILAAGELLARLADSATNSRAITPCGLQSCRDRAEAAV